MSVPVNQRTEGKLEVCVKAHDLCCYTIQITSNTNTFPEKFQHALTDCFSGWTHTIKVYGGAKYGTDYTEQDGFKGQGGA